MIPEEEGRKTSQSPEAAGKAAHAEVFHSFAYWASTQLGSHWAFVAALVVVIVWAALGPVFHFSENWQLVINTGTTIITFLMVFIIQSSQNRDAKAIHLKLDELIRSSQARNVFADLQNASEAELDSLQHDFKLLRKRSRDGVVAGDSREIGANAEAAAEEAATPFAT